MTQQHLPIFPKDAHYLTPNLAVQEEKGTVWYFFSGAPIFSHEKEELGKFQFITSNLLALGRCRNKDIVEAFGVSSDSVRRWKKKFMEEGEKPFFETDNRKGHSHKLTDDKLHRIQKKLDQGRSNNSIAKEEGFKEGTIRYAIKQGRLKKSRNKKGNKKRKMLRRKQKTHQ